MLWIRFLFLFTSLFDGSVKYDVVAKKLTIAGISGYVFWCAINSCVAGSWNSRKSVGFLRNKSLVVYNVIGCKVALYEKQILGKSCWQT